MDEVLAVPTWDLMFPNAFQVSNPGLLTCSLLPLQTIPLPDSRNETPAPDLGSKEKGSKNYGCSLFITNRIWTLRGLECSLGLILVLGMGRTLGKGEPLASEAGERCRKSLPWLTVRTQEPFQR